jgi:hypothetical protein
MWHGAFASCPALPGLSPRAQAPQLEVLGRRCSEAALPAALVQTLLPSRQGADAPAATPSNLPVPVLCGRLQAAASAWPGPRAAGLYCGGALLGELVAAAVAHAAAALAAAPNRASQPLGTQPAALQGPGSGPGARDRGAAPHSSPAPAAGAADPGIPAADAGAGSEPPWRNPPGHGASAVPGEADGGGSGTDSDSDWQALAAVGAVYLGGAARGAAGGARRRVTAARRAHATAATTSAAARQHSLGVDAASLAGCEEDEEAVAAGSAPGPAGSDATGRGPGLGSADGLGCGAPADGMAAPQAAVLPSAEALAAAALRCWRAACDVCGEGASGGRALAPGAAAFLRGVMRDVVLLARADGDEEGGAGHHLARAVCGLASAAAEEGGDAEALRAAAASAAEALHGFAAALPPLLQREASAVAAQGSWAAVVSGRSAAANRPPAPPRPTASDTIGDAPSPVAHAGRGPCISAADAERDVAKGARMGAVAATRAPTAVAQSAWPEEWPLLGSDPASPLHALHVIACQDREAAERVFRPESSAARSAASPGVAGRQRYAAQAMLQLRLRVLAGGTGVVQAQAEADGASQAEVTEETARFPLPELLREALSACPDLVRA